MEDLIIIMVTCVTEEEAVLISDGLVKKNLAACVNISGVRSVFYWQGKIENQDEWLLIIKSIRSKFGDIEKYVKASHSYNYPEVIAFDVAAVSAEYADWVRSSCGIESDSKGE